MSNEFQDLISDYERFPSPLEFEFDEEKSDFFIESHPKETSDRFFLNSDDVFSLSQEDLPKLTQSWSDISLDCDEHSLKSEVLRIEDELSEELDVHFNIENDLQQQSIKKTKQSSQYKSKYKYQSFEAMTARLEFEDLEILRSLKSHIKSTRQDYVKPDGVKRERITENMILRSLVKCFAHHSLNNHQFKWGQVNTEEDLFRQISRSFKGIDKEGISPSQL